MTTESSSTSPSNEAPLQGLDLSQLGPGRRLRDARKVMNLDQADIAANLNLALSVVNALERDDYADMPPPVFVRGYLRAYAVLVNQQEDEICTMYDALIGKDAEDDPFRPVALTGEEVSGDAGGMVKSVAAVVVLLLFGGLAAWFLAPQWFDANQDGLAPEAVSEATSNSGQAMPEYPSAAREGGGVTQAVAEPESQRVPVVDRNMGGEVSSSAPSVDLMRPADEPTVSTQPAIENIVEPVAPSEMAKNTDTVNDAMAEVAEARSSEEIKPAVEALVVPGDTEAEQQEQAVQATDASVIEETAVTETDSEVATLSLSFSGSCWTSISDASGKRLVYGVMKAGMEKNVSGTLPFKVILGQADAVKMRLNEQPFDHERFSRGKIARFSIGDDDT